ncbi:conjugal transfer protein, partial [Listeria monocytogenes]|nr:conjugal transfer protein [Listeria monocytogenes]
QFELFGNLLKKHEISQQDYISSQTEFAKETIEELEKQHKQRKVQLASAPIFHEKKQEDDLNKKEINLPEQPIESEVTEEEEEKELLMSDILSSFDEGIEENTTNNDNSELPF